MGEVPSFKNAAAKSVLKALSGEKSITDQLQDAKKKAIDMGTGNNDDGEGKKKKDDRDKSLDRFHVPPILRPLEATHEFLEKEEQERFNLTEASYEYHKGGLPAAEGYLNAMDMSDFKIDPELSTDDMLVVQRPEHTAENPKIELAARGADMKNFSDMKRVAKTLASVIPGAERSGLAGESYPEGRQMVSDVMSKYGKLPEHGSGFSNGGNKMGRIAENYPIKTSVFNPLINPRGRKDFKPLAKQLLHRTTDDIASIPVAWSGENEMVETRSYPTKKGTPRNPVSAHMSDQFKNRTGENIRTNGYIHDSQDLANKMGQYINLDNFEKAERQGKTFTETMHEDLNKGPNSRDTVIHPETGTPVLNGGVHHEASPMVRAWRDVGGLFTRKEVAAISNRKFAEPESPDGPEEPRSTDLEPLADKIEEAHANPLFGLDNDESRAYVQSSPAERERIKQETLEAHNRAVAGTVEPMAPVETTAPAPNFRQRVASDIGNQVSIGAMGVGFGASQLANKAANAVDPDDKIPEIARDTGVGALTGFLTGVGTAATVGSAATGMSAFFLPEIAAGAAGSAVGYETFKGSEDLLKYEGVDPTVAQYLSAPIAGATGGATTGTMLGAYFGGPAGAAAGAAVGATTGFIGGAAQDVGALTTMGTGELVKKAGGSDKAARTIGDATGDAAEGAVGCGLLGLAAGAVAAAATDGMSIPATMAMCAAGGGIWGAISSLWS